MKKNIFIIILIVVAIILLKYSFSAIGKFFDRNNGSNKGNAPSVLVEDVAEHEIVRSFTVPGRINAKYRVNVLPRIDGYLQKSYFKEGDSVKTGQVLFLIEPAEYINDSNIASANVSNIKSKLDYAEKQLKRAEDLVKKDYIAKAKYDELLSSRDALRAQLASAQAELKDTQRNYGYTHVKAPVDGKVGLITVTVGNYVNTSSQPLTTIYSTNPIYVAFSINSDDFNKLSNIDLENNKNRRVELYFSNGMKYNLDGVQDFQDNKIDDSTGTITLRATFQNPNGQLLHGELVNVKIYSNKKTKVPVVPLTAVSENQAGKYVYKIDEKGLAQLVYIKANEQNGKFWVVEDGLKVGDKIVTDGLQKVQPNKSVKIISPEEMEKIKNKEVEDSNAKR